MRDVAYDTVREMKLSRLTPELDGTVLRSGLRVDGAARGFNPHPPKDKSCDPLTAHLAQTGALLAISNRTGNVHDSEGVLELRSFLVSDLREKLGSRCFEVRLDGDTIWSREAEGRFPDLKELKQLVRDRVAPDKQLGHSDA